MPDEKQGTDPAGILKDAREGLSADERKIVRKIVARYELDLIGALPEMLAGVRASGKQSSFSETVSMKPTKGSNMMVRLEPRVRCGREAEEFEAHIDDSNQLSLGYVDVEDDAAEDEGDVGLGKPIGFDADPSGPRH